MGRKTGGKNAWAWGSLREAAEELTKQRGHEVTRDQVWREINLSPNIDTINLVHSISSRINQKRKDAKEYAKKVLEEQRNAD